MKFGLNEEVYNKIEKIVKENSKYRFKIFGSRAKNTYKNTSDIDIAVFEEVSKEDEYKIRNEFDLLDIIYKIDLVFVDKNLKKEFLEEILKEGIYHIYMMRKNLERFMKILKINIFLKLKNWLSLLSINKTQSICLYVNALGFILY